MKTVLANNKATLFIVATPIGNLSEVSNRTLEVLNFVDVIACEDTRNSAKLFSHYDIHTKYIAYHNFNETESAEGIVQLLAEGKNVALISDAGYPLISDPGYVLVNRVIEEDYNITTISGPNAALNALVSSGLETQHYLFYGFLNSKQSQARKELENLKNFPYTIIFYEAPHRIEKTLKLILDIFGDRKAVLARELTKIHETFYRSSVSKLCELKDLKGEIVLIVEGYKNEEQEIDVDELLLETKKLVDSGSKTKQAVNEISKKYNYSKNNLYNEYLKKYHH